MFTCFYCQKKTEDVKRCSRCRLVTYCSKECQTISWKVTHKKSCRPHPGLFDEDGNPKPEPSEVGSAEWTQLEVDKQLSKWLEQWRGVFCMYAVICLDLANHPHERIVSHCLVIRVRPELFQEKRFQSYRAVSAEVESREHVEKMFPELAPIVADPTDLSRARFVLILENANGEMLRVRLNQWNDLSIPKWRGIPQAEARKLAQDGTAMMVHAVNNMDPAEVIRLMTGN
ncbi:hypothetical protein BC628DRAFT_1310298 [Trametes gibbosa]|nr:hypothetical protein BC628DRAFT_1310298 [Trametes gibbosa]